MRREKWLYIIGSINPLDIATGAEGGKTTIHVEGEQSIVDMLQLNNLFYLLRRDGLIWATIVIVILLGTMLFVRKSEKLAERKADIFHKLLIVFLISSVIWILAAAVSLFDFIF